MCVDCGWSGSPPSAGGERYDSLLLEGAAEWTRLGVGALVLELFVMNLEPLSCILLAKFWVSSQLHGGVSRAAV